MQKSMSDPLRNGNLRNPKESLRQVYLYTSLCSKKVFMMHYTVAAGVVRYR